MMPNLGTFRSLKNGLIHGPSTLGNIYSLKLDSKGSHQLARNPVNQSASHLQTHPLKIRYAGRTVDRHHAGFTDALALHAAVNFEQTTR